MCNACINHVTNYYLFKQQSLKSQQQLELILSIRKSQIIEEPELSELTIKEERPEQIKTEYISSDDDSLPLLPPAEIVHSDHSEDNKPEKPYCHPCNETFITESALQKHNQITHLERKYKCDECTKTFVALGSLNNHKLQHGNHCLKCFKRFDTTAELKEHRLEHKNDSYICKECGKEFKKKLNLKIHSKVHTGERPHLCTYCGRAFALLSNLNAHLRIHNGIRPYTCEYCGK